MRGMWTPAQQVAELDSRVLGTGYRIAAILGESLHAFVCRGRRESEPERPLVLKVLKTASLSEPQARYLRHKIERLRVIDHPGAVVPHTLVSQGSAHFLVYRDVPGVPLDRWERVNRPTRLNDFFTIALGLAEVLNAVHQAGVIHGGVRPHNILFDAETPTVYLVDFLSPLDVRDISHFIYDLDFIEGTLAYTSPEQTGRINLRVDFSTDMYSLAITLYELLVGDLPFRSRDPLELIHCHLAEEVPNVHTVRPEIPRVVGDIIAKLALKEPEKRYQSAVGLRADLERCRLEHLATGTIAPFPLGIHDHSRRVSFVSKMVGREREASLVLNEYGKVVRGAFRAVFISGLSGIGKTRLIQELQRPLVKHKGYFTSGKFDQYQKNVPYSSLLQALRNLVRTLLTESDSRVAAWKAKLLDALVPHAQVVIDVVPELAVLIGPQPPVQPLPPAEARQRFNAVFNRFLSCMASAENPLVLFIDDMQWCDAASFEFLQSLFANAADHPYLFFIGAYRHNEVDSSHPLIHLMRAIEDRGEALQIVRLGPLGPVHCHEMVAYILDAQEEHSGPLADFLVELTEGNPLFVSESLSYLHQQKLLHVDRHGAWRWQLDEIRRSDMPASVVELFSAKITKLPSDTLGILVLCACMGNRFAPEDIARIREITLVELYERLKPGLSLGLLVEHKHDFQFVHDRVQEAVLRLLPADERRAIHWSIGHHLLGGLQTELDAVETDRLFTIAAHLNLGKAREPDPATAADLCRINFHAGNRALDALATEAANGYFRASRAALPADAWQSAYTTSFRIHQCLAKTELMCGRPEQSRRLIDELIAHAQNELDKAEALAEQTTSLSSVGNFIDAVDTANRGLAYFDQALPASSDAAQRKMQSLMADIHREGDDLWARILDMPFTTERRARIELAFYAELIPDLYLSGQVPQLYLAAAQSTRLCLAGGMDESVIYSFSIMGLNLGEQARFDLAFRYEDLARELCARHPDTFGATRGMNGIAWCNMHSRSRPGAIVEYCRKSIQSGKNCGDLYNAGLSYGPLMWNLQVLGDDFSRIADAAQECLDFSRKNQLSFSVGLAEAVEAGWVAPMMRDDAAVPMADKLALWERSNHIASVGSYFVLRAISQHYLGDYVAAAASLEAVERYLHGLTDNVLKRQCKVFEILNALRLYERGCEPGGAARLQALIAPLVDELETWSQLGPLLVPYMALIAAERERILGSPRQARALYLDAIEIADAHGYVFLRGYLNECLGELMLGEGSQTGRGYLREADRLYRRCGAAAMEAKLRRKHPSHLPLDVAPAGVERTVEAPATLPDLDLDYLVKSSLAIVAETDLDALLRKIMQVVTESSGAQRGYLIMREGDNFAIRARSDIAERGAVKTETTTLAEAPGVSVALVNYVYRTREKVLLGGGSGPAYLADLASKEPGSLLCLPVIKRNMLVGLLYLENRLGKGMFTAAQTRVTEVIAAHAAISLENARLLAETRAAEARIQELNVELERRVEERTAQLALANRELESFSYSVSHDLRAPLRSIRDFSTILLEYYADELDDYGRDGLNRIVRASQRMGFIIDDLLQLSRIARTEVRRERIDLGVAAREILDDLLPQGAAVSIDIETGLFVDADPGLVRIMLENLLANAIKFTSKTASPEIGLRRGNDSMTFVLSDNGAGFDAKYADKLFVPFQRLHSENEFEGIGIGLAIVRRIVERHGGQIRAQGERGHGAKFYFRFR
ncbi:hypothetical protein CJ010_10895 [Azoarcus sp. DD4]|uniref:AAA family ATPase n=1 Tax=Azoarcus sp. DD4 TaxID=2027405 RepID=UPI001125F938|nr:AAA family ATPase [Azoarcus sp. DD4]QDF96998.1 hypothetical protein CJ010_10895 [Azoarcus sp. DD4]